MPPKSNYFGKGSVVVSSDGEGRVYRLAIMADRLVTWPFEGIDVIPDIVAYTARTYGSLSAMGWRDIVHIHEEEVEVEKTVAGKQVTEIKKRRFFELSDFVYIGFLDVQARVLELARGLLYYGIQKTDVFSIYAQTRQVLLLVPLLGLVSLPCGTHMMLQRELAAHVVCMCDDLDACRSGL